MRGLRPAEAWQGARANWNRYAGWLRNDLQ